MSGKDALILSKTLDSDWLILMFQDIGSKLCRMSAMSSGIILYFQDIQITTIYIIMYSLIFNEILDVKDDYYNYLINLNIILILISRLKLSNKVGYMIITSMNFYNNGFHSNGTLLVEMVGINLLCN